MQPATVRLNRPDSAIPRPVGARRFSRLTAQLLANATPTGVAVNAVVFDFNSAGALVNPVGPVNVGAFVVSVNAATGAVTVQ